MANKQEIKRDKKEEITKENAEVTQKNETKNVKAKKVTTKKENMQAKENKTDTGKKKSESVNANKKTKITGTKKSNKTNNTNKVETNSKKTTKATGKVNKSSNGKKNESTKSESKETKVENKKDKNKKDKNKKVVTKKENKKNLEKNDTEIDEENAVTEVKEEVVKLEEIKSTLNKKNKIPKEKLEEIYGLIFKNIAIAAVIMVYFIFLNLGQMNIKTDIYQTDLKVFSITSLLISIVLFEKAYKKDSGEIAIYGIETLILAIITLTLIYINLMFSSRYVFIVNSISCIFAIYYLIKSVIIYIKKRKKCYIDDMKEIINKEEE